MKKVYNHPRTRRSILLGSCALGVFVTTACSDADSVDTATSQKTLLQTEAEVFNFSFEIPANTQVSQIVASGSKYQRIADRAQLGGAAVSSDGKIEAGNDATLSTILAEQDIRIGGRTLVRGDVTSGGSVQVESSASISGTVLSAQPMGADQLIEWEVDAVTDFESGVQLEPEQTRDLAPGAYRDVSVKSRSTLTLHTGIYVFTSFQIDPQARLLIDSSDGPVQIYVKSGLFFRGLIQSTSAQQPQLFVGYLGSDSIFIEAPFTGVVVAPDATVRLQSARPEGHRGAFYGEELYLEPDTKIAPMPFDWVDVVDDGVVLPPLPTEPPHVMPESPGDVSIVVTGWQGGGTPTGTGSWSSGDEPVEFELKDEFEVEGGAIGNGTVTFTYADGGGTSHSCTYQGQSPTEQPSTKLDLALARLLAFVSCTDGQPHDAPRSGTDFTIEVQGIPGYPVTVGSPMTKDGFCSEKLELLTASETAQMRADFNWNNATLVPEYDADNRPTLYYAWVYLRDEAELTSYRKLLIHQLNRPLFEDELDEFSGRCGALTNPGDGEGAFVLSVIPGVTYNRLIRARTSDEIEGTREIFDAVILREVPEEVQSTGGSISYEALAEAGFRYLHYQDTNPLSSNGGLELDGGVSKALTDALSWVGEAVVNVGEAILEGLGELDELFRGDIDVTVWVHEINSDPAFDLTNNAPMIRAWGTHRGRPLGANDVQITVMQKTFGTFIPSESKAWSDMDGRAVLDVVGGETRGNGLCVELKSEGAMVTGFLLAQEVCDFRGFDQNVSSTIADFRLGRMDNDRREVPVLVDNERLAGLYQADDLHQWSDNVIGFSTKRARILTGYWADTFAPPGGGGQKSLFAPCLNYSNTVSDAMLAASAAGGVLAGSLIGVPVLGAATAVFGSVVGNTDIVMAENSSIRQSRNVMSHEYGHYLFCSLLQEHDSGSVSHVVWSTIADGDDRSSPVRYLNEAMADFFTGQVAGAADYSWLSDTFGADYCFDNGNACFDQNLFGTTTSTTGVESIGRVATMIHDLVDGRIEGFNAHVPGNADLWNGAIGSLDLSNTQYGSKDAHLERLILPGPNMLTLTKHIADAFGDFSIQEGISDQAIYESVDATMEELGVTWCDRCRLMALHVPGSQGNVQELWETCTTDGMLSDILGPPPVENLRMSSFDDGALGITTCQACPSGFTSDQNGQCVFCPETVSGNTCEICPADVVIDGATVDVRGLYDWPTNTSVAGDVCPDVFWLEVQNVSNIFTRALSFSSGIQTNPGNEVNCEQQHSFTTSWFGPGGSESTQTTSGTWWGCGGEDICLERCEGLPGSAIAPADVQTQTVRFGAPADETREVWLDFFLQSNIPR